VLLCRKPATVQKKPAAAKRGAIKKERKKGGGRVDPNAALGHFSNQKKEKGQGRNYGTHTKKGGSNPPKKGRAKKGSGKHLARESVLGGGKHIEKKFIKTKKGPEKTTYEMVRPPIKGVKPEGSIFFGPIKMLFQGLA